MEKLYNKLTLGLAATLILYGIFFAYEVQFMESYAKKEVTLSNGIIKQDLQILNNEAIRSLELKVDNMDRYVDASQKNLDWWLKFLALFLTIIIGLSVFSGLRDQERAKEELSAIKEIKNDIKRAANQTEESLKNTNEQLKLIEKNALSSIELKESMTQQLNEISNRKDKILDDSQTQIIEKTIIKSKEDLQKTGIETLKNLYYAKSLKAQNDKNWDEVIRLITIYLDFDENSKYGFSIRSHAYFKSYRVTYKVELLDLSLTDVNKVIQINSTDDWAFNMRGLIYATKRDDEKAIVDYTEAIKLKPDNALPYYNRYLAYTKLHKPTEAEIDKKRALELGYVID